MPRTCRGLYNWWVMKLRAGERWNWKHAKKTLAQSRTFDPAIDQVYGKLLAEVSFRLDKAMQAFFKRVAAGKKPGFPRVRPRHQFFTLCYPAAYLLFEGKRLILPTGGKGRHKLFPTVVATLAEVPPCGFREVAISRDARGHSHASFVYEAPEGEEHTGGVVAFDVGLKTLAVGYNGRGRFYHVGGFKGYRWYNRQLNKLRSRRDRCQKKSRRSIHLSQVYQRVSERKRNKRTDSSRTKQVTSLPTNWLKALLWWGTCRERQMVTKEHTKHQKALHRAVYNDWGL